MRAEAELLQSRHVANLKRAEESVNTATLFDN
jgi:hypothetical protein